MMQAAQAATTAATGRVSQVTVTAAAPAAHKSAFDTLLSELNPLQYLPVIGTIYRALTGDTISEEARTVGSLVVSGLTGGPVGVAINVAELAVEKVTGLDPEKISQGLLADIGIGHRAPKPTPKISAAPAKTPATTALAAQAPAPTPPAPAAGWSAAQLAAYGVTTGARGTLKRGDVQGSDVLNDLELARLRAAA
jgi:hypothetical protein